jgi:membrane protease YdiL (CAAX protease family)
MLDIPGSEDAYDSRIPSPFPSGLLAGAARRQAMVLLVLFYGLVYGGGYLASALRSPFAAPVLSALFLGTLMLLATGFAVRRDASWRDSLGLEHQPSGSMLGWSLLGFVGTYAVNLVISTAYLALQGNLEVVMAHRVTLFGKLAEVPLGAILPIAAFVAIWEETVFRGFILGRFRAAIPVQNTPGAPLRRDALAVALAALCFGAGHGYQGGLGLLQTTVAGLGLGALAIWRKSIWPAIGAHFVIDAFGLLLLKVLQSLLPTIPQ